MIEIMSPVGSWESLAAALQGGAGSVYFGVQGLNMRSASSVNFSLDDLAEIVSRCREAGVKSYLTLNTVLYDDDLQYMRSVMERAKQERVTAVIVSDQAALNYAWELGLEIHLSTQLNISNIESVKFYSAFADVVVLARELNLHQVRSIYDQIRERNIRGPKGEYLRIEMFVHGALCMAVSGKCYLSLHEAWKSANRGSCRQICRRAYNVKDIETGAELVVDNKYIMSPKDLCTIDFLDKVLDAGVEVLKIEGRARGGDYVRTVTECYRKAADAYQKGSYTLDFALELKERLRRVFNRDFWGGYYLGHSLGEWSRAYGSSATRKKVYVGKVTNYFSNIGIAEVTVEASDLPAGSECLILGATTGAIEFIADEIRVDLKAVQATFQGERCSIATPELVRRGDKLYKMVRS
ncbi:Collagenase precursor [Mucinivorans hirudinis]|uniref:Collagenase n=1 Tax=Mucinivorans hirudinis TaxID=1433126 RepID=A0A060R9A8_9BACT|nr:Collagenase precursor [Mucinivorans hirudinis]